MKKEKISLMIWFENVDGLEVPSKYIKMAYSGKMEEEVMLNT